MGDVVGIKVMRGAHKGFHAAPLANYCFMITLVVINITFISNNLVDVLMGAGLVVVCIVGLLLPVAMGDWTPVLTHTMICCVELVFTILWIIASAAVGYTAAAMAVHAIAIVELGSVITLFCVFVKRVEGFETIQAPVLLPPRKTCKLLPVIFSSLTACIVCFCLFLVVTANSARAKTDAKEAFYDETISHYLKYDSGKAMPIFALASVLMMATAFARHPFKREDGNFNFNNILLASVCIMSGAGLVGLSICTERQMNIHLTFTAMFFVLLFAYLLTTSLLMLHNIIAGSVRRDVRYCGIVALNVLASLAIGLFFGLWALNGMKSKNYFEWMSVFTILVDFVLASAVAWCTEIVAREPFLLDQDFFTEMR